MIRVLQLGMTDNIGGIETYLMNYYRNIDRTKLQFDFVDISNDNLCYKDEIKSLGGNIYSISSYYKHPLKYIKELKKIVIENKYEIVHCNMNSAVMLFPIIAAKLAKVKVIIAHSHNSSSDKGIVKEFLHNVNKRFIPLFANTYYACSQEAAKWFFSKKIINSSNFYIINNGIEVQKFKRNDKIREQIRKELKIEDKFVIGHIGRFVPQKNHKFLIDIFNELYKKNIDAVLLLVGDGELRKNVENKVKELHLENKVIFLGIRNDVPKILQGCDMFLLPSLYEGLPIVGIEAQISQNKCLFANTITREAKISDETEFINITSTSEWVEAIKKYKESKKEITVDIEKFNIKNNAKELQCLYFKLSKEKEDI